MYSLQNSFKVYLLLVFHHSEPKNYYRDEKGEERGKKIARLLIRYAQGKKIRKRDVDCWLVLCNCIKSQMNKYESCKEFFLSAAYI